MTPSMGAPHIRSRSRPYRVAQPHRGQVSGRVRSPAHVARPRAGGIRTDLLVRYDQRRDRNASSSSSGSAWGPPRPPRRNEGKRARKPRPNASRGGTPHGSPTAPPASRRRSVPARRCEARRPSRVARGAGERRPATPIGLIDQRDADSLSEATRQTQESRAVTLRGPWPRRSAAPHRPQGGR